LFAAPSFSCNIPLFLTISFLLFVQRFLLVILNFLSSDIRAKTDAS